MKTKIAIAFVVGFLVWTFLWLATDSAIQMIPNFRIDTGNDGKITYIPTAYLVLKLILSVIFSIISGLIAATISKEISKAPLVLGIGLLIVGIFFQIGAWDLLPLWYHLIFLILLLPATVLGGKLRSFEEVTR